MSRPHRSLWIAISLTLTCALLLPYSPFADVLGFSPMPPLYFIFLLTLLLAYLTLAQLVKSAFFRSYRPRGPERMAWRKPP
jgi:P-type Mg2+ transporter